jgi:perosamine synthetase
MRYPVSQPDLTGAEDLVVQSLRVNWISSGPMTRAFEAGLAERLEVPADRVITTTSGTTALHLALATLGIRPGDEVIVPDLTYISTANVVRHLGARVRFVDIDPQTFCLDIDQVAAAITPYTRAIVPVHLYGSAVDMDPLLALARKHHLAVVEDAAQGFSGRYAGRALGTLGDVGCFSFFANKILTTGEGGACVVKYADVAKRLRSMGGMCNDPIQRYRHTAVGFNYRITDVQAAIGLAQLQRLDAMLTQRRAIFAQYQARLVSHVSFPDSVVAPWLFTCLLPWPVDRWNVVTHLAAHGIDTRPTFVPMHQHAFFGEPYRRFPVADTVALRGISLPTYVGLTEADVNFICDRFLEVVP